MVPPAFTNPSEDDWPHLAITDASGPLTVCSLPLRGQLVILITAGLDSRASLSVFKIILAKNLCQVITFDDGWDIIHFTWMKPF